MYGDGFTIKGNSCSGSGNWFTIATNGANNCKIINNDLTEAEPSPTSIPVPFPPGQISTAQIRIAPNSSNNLLFGNKIGSPGSNGGIWCAGDENRIVENTFHGDYQGWTTGAGFILLDSGSEYNEVAGLKKATPPHGFDICDQVLDDGTNNRIVGYEKCAP